ncbi:hypothetical protein TIFTF001_014674 [Ficus carica]|uniref:Hydroxyproline O-arabinosyltransferase-like domain-containing protein n=1 Tax=Ficus carica TaxID=3494 RepID=A0AA88D4C5_FICCA|nr:hypothetical protein TIFTF001_014674 [Ficus carica]
MGCGNMFFSVLITFSVALITYNIIISANAPLKQGFPGPSTGSLISVDPIIKMPVDRSKSAKPTSKRLFHTAVTASDSVYNTWQCRIMYYWFKKFNYILMAEPDHIIVKPIPNLSRDGLGAAFPFFYIEPKKYEKVLRKYFPEHKGPVTKIDPIGNSPVIVGRESLKKIAPTWMNISLAMKKDPETDKAFGWVLEMYAYAVSSALHDVGNILYKDFMIQPPWDLKVGNKFIIHYTYGCDYNMKGELTYGKIGEWRFDKRSFDSILPPRNLPLPPPGVPESVVCLILPSVPYDVVS